MVQNLIMEIPIVMKTKLIIPFFVLMVASTMSLMAQDTIDTAYYRYNFNSPPSYYDPDIDLTLPDLPPVLIDSLTGQPVIDTETGSVIPVCPNGVGFCSYGVYPRGNEYYAEERYHICNMKQPGLTIYGVALLLDTIYNFTVGDSMVFIFYERSNVTHRFVPFDSILIKGGEIGVRRHLELPIMPSEGVRRIASNDEFLGFCSSLHDNCIDRIEYARIKEFYLDTPYQLLGDTLWYKTKFYCSHGSEYMEAVVTSDYISYEFSSMVLDDDEYYEFFERTYPSQLSFCTPIIEPLPDWEVALLDTLIPMPTKPENPDPDPNDPNNPDNPGDPNDPDNPDDPNNPDNPEDPDDPTDPEAIDGVYGNLPISIYPNPTNGVTTITSPEAIKELTVTDLAGRELLHRSSLGTTTTIDTAPLEPGLYLLKVTTASGTATTKLAVR